MLKQFISTAAVCLSVQLSTAQTTGIECVAEQVVFRQSADRAYGPIASSGSLVAYTYNGNSDHLVIYDASDPASPVLLSDTPGLGINEEFGAELEMSSTLLISSNFSEIRVIDISDPTSPSIRSVIDTTVFYIKLDGTRLIVHTGSRIEIYDLSDPSSPVLMGSFEDPSNPIGMSLSGSTLCMADRDSGLRLYDVSDPTTIAAVGRFPHDDRTWGVASDGDVAVLMTSPPKSQIYIDISDPALPREIQTSGYDVFTRDGGVFFGDSLTLRTILGVEIIGTTSITEPSFNRIISGPDVLDRQHITPLGSDLAMISAGGFSIIDLSQNGPQTSVIYDGSPATIAPDALLVGMHIDGNHGYTYDTVNGKLFVLDVSTPSAPFVVSELFVGTVEISREQPIAYANNTVFVCDSSLQIRAVDVSDPLNPGIINTWDGWDPSFGAQGNRAWMEYSGGFLYVLPNLGPLTVFDVSDLSSPGLAHTYEIAQSLTGKGMAVSDDRLVYLSNSQGGGSSLDTLNVFDISDPMSPVEINPAPDQHGFLVDLFDGGIEIDGHRLVLSLGGYLFAGDQPAGSLATFDIGSAYSMLDRMLFEPFENSFSSGARLRKLVTNGDFAYVSTGSSVALFDISEPADIRYIGASASNPGPAVASMSFDRERLFMSGLDQITVWDASNCVLCPADLNGDGTLNFFDVSAFLIAFNAQDPIADFTDDGNWDFFDVSAFIIVLTVGCP